MKAAGVDGDDGAVGNGEERRRSVGAGVDGMDKGDAREGDVDVAGKRETGRRFGRGGGEHDGIG